MVVNTAAGGLLVTVVVRDDPRHQCGCRHEDRQADRERAQASPTSLTRVTACGLAMRMCLRELLAPPLLGDHGR